MGVPASGAKRASTGPTVATIMLVVLSLALGACSAVLGGEHASGAAPPSAPTASATVSASTAAIDAKFLPAGAVPAKGSDSRLRLGDRGVRTTTRGTATVVSLVQAITNEGISVQDLSLAAKVQSLGTSLTAATTEDCPRYLDAGKTGYLAATLRLDGLRRAVPTIDVPLTEAAVSDDPDSVLSVRSLQLLAGKQGVGTRASGLVVNDGTEMVHSALVCVILHSKTRPTLSATSFYPIGPVTAHKTIRFTTDIISPIERSQVEATEAFAVGDW